MEVVHQIASSTMATSTDHHLHHHQFMFDPMLIQPSSTTMTDDVVGFSSPSSYSSSSSNSNDYNNSSSSSSSSWTAAQYCWDRFESSIGGGGSGSPLALSSSDQWLSDLQYNQSACGNDFICTLTYSPGTHLHFIQSMQVIN